MSDYEEQLEEENEALRSQCATLKDGLHEATDHLNDTISELEDRQHEVETLQNQVEDLEEKVHNLEEKTEKLEEERDKFERDYEHEKEEVCLIQIEYERLEEAFDEMRSEHLSSYGQEDVDRFEFMDRIDECKTVYELLRNEKCPTTMLDLLKKRMKSLDNELSLLKKKPKGSGKS